MENECVWNRCTQITAGCVRINLLRAVLVRRGSMQNHFGAAELLFLNQKGPRKKGIRNECVAGLVRLRKKRADKSKQINR